ncbi:MAG TPA: tripartite tricarboxylate transporter substrate binding protein [Ramlibacter sp.]|jgi:tripartite-type tricarboxylate transporter receptor subunit TctC|nr:tripartite tricarboxylate transporter substrate binding protein [Ramlibacter sp.]
MDAPLRALKAAVAAVALGLALTAQAAYPERPVRIVVPYAPGGSSDVIARAISEELARELGQPVIVDNRAGAGSLLGTQHAAGEAPNGYTLLLADVPFTIVPALYRERARYSADKSFAPVALLGVAPMYLFVNQASPLRTATDLVQQAKAAPGKVSIASGGNGSLTHLMAELFMIQAGVQLVHVPYKGAGPAMTDLAAGQVQASFTTMPTATALFQAGRVRPLAVSSPQRTRETPDVPTFRELGLPDMSVQSWWGLLAPAGTPADVMGRVGEATQKVLRDPKVRARLQTVGLSLPEDTGAPVLQKMIATDAARWQDVIQRAKITAD